MLAFAGEMPGVMAHDQRLAFLARSEDLDFAAENDEKRHRPVAHLDEHLAAA